MSAEIIPMARRDAAPRCPMVLEAIILAGKAADMMHEITVSGGDADWAYRAQVIRCIANGNRDDAARALQVWRTL